MATADCTTSTHDEGDCCEEGLHSLSCSEDEDRGELVCTGLIFILKHTAASQCSIANTSCCLDHEKGLSCNFSPYMQKCNHVQILNGT